jgi:chromosome segregation ATPase
MGGWGTSSSGLKSEKDVIRFVENFCNNEEADQKRVEFCRTIFKTKEEATAHCEKENKWGPALAAMYKTKPKAELTKAKEAKIESIKAEIKSLKHKEHSTTKEMGDARRAGKIFAKCDSCESRVNLSQSNNPDYVGNSDEGYKYKNPDLNAYLCPVCKTGGLTPSELKPFIKAITKIVKDIRELEEKIRAIRAAAEEKNDADEEILWTVTVSIPT